MNRGILITIIGVIIIGILYLGFQVADSEKEVKEDIGQISNRNLIRVATDYQIDLTDLGSVRENLNGFWIPENNIDGENILWLDFHKKKNFAIWETIPYTDKIRRTKELPINSCETIAALIKLNGKVHIEFVGLGGSDTTEIESLSKTKFKIYGMTYLRHKGYDFLKSWNVHGYESEK